MDRSQLIAALRSKSEFITIASHQLRGPMTDITWALQTLVGDASLGDTSKLIVVNSLAAAQGLTQRIEDLLSVAKMEEGQAGYDFEQMDIVAFVGKILADILPSAQKAGVKIYFDRPAVALPEVMIDDKRLSIALVNLLENAIRYNVANGEVSVRIAEVPESLLSRSASGIPALEFRRMRFRNCSRNFIAPKTPWHRRPKVPDSVST